ncbi:MAG: RNA 2',3'-cyclic phosphodiesterase [Candidatus Omnitrophota bacterium]|jgi:2'-5' RNA ligase
MGETLRAFLALPLSEIFELEIRFALQQLQPVSRKINWVQDSQVHLTLHFFGTIPSGAVESIRKTIAPLVAAHSAPALSLKGVGCFPDEQRPRILWLGVGGQTAALLALQRDIECALALLRFPSEERAFVPHVTVGRVQKDQRIQWSTPDRLSEWQTEILPARRLVLFRSHLSPQGPRYEILETFPFSGR